MNEMKKIQQEKSRLFICKFTRVAKNLESWKNLEFDNLG